MNYASLDKKALKLEHMIPYTWVRARIKRVADLGICWRASAECRIGRRMTTKYDQRPCFRLGASESSPLFTIQYKTWFIYILLAVLRIHDSLGWIRIRLWIRGSMPLTSGSGSCYFRHWPSRCQQKTNFLTQFFLLITFEATFTSFFKDKKSKRVTK